MDKSLKILVLILASDSNPLYIEFQKLWKHVMNLYPNIQCFFYKADPTLEEEYKILDSNTILVKCEERLDTVWEKTLKVFTLFEPYIDKYDYIFRTNLSSFIYFPGYLEFCKKLPKEQCCASFVGKYNDLVFPSGAGITMSPDIVKRMVKESPPLFVQDDVTIGQTLDEWGIPLIKMPRYDIVNADQFGILDNITKDFPIFHYRLKCHNFREKDLYNYIRLLEIYYHITV